MNTTKSFNDNSRRNLEKQMEFSSGMFSNSKPQLTIKEQVEIELNRRVREALDTPPLERIKRNQQEALQKKSQQEDFKKTLNSHINFNEKDKIKFFEKIPASTKVKNALEMRSDHMSQLPTDEHKTPTISEYNKFEFWLKSQFEQPKMHLKSASLKPIVRDENVKKDLQPSKISKNQMKDFGSLTLREKEILFATFTKEGFLVAMKTGLLPDGSELQALPNGSYKDRFDIVRDYDGPFWPKDVGPLHPTPLHKRIPSEEEPLLDPIREKDDNMQISSSQSQYTGKWRHAQIIFDTETSSRDQIPPCLSDKICPGLLFESRFESGNLRQVRRIGQFEYQLVLNNDLYTKRHTQWFYFRVQNMLKEITYKFIIINLLKPTSLYMKGMRMLIYSEKSAAIDNIGWHRTGHHIRYSRNVTHLQCPLLDREIAHFQLEFQLEFDYSDDSCYLSHCYPYTFTDLKQDLSNYQINNKIAVGAVCRQEVLCETKLGNSCYLLTVTDKNVPDNTKLGAVITARVHPGETNASWMMNGLIRYLISDCETAKKLREKILFKIIPMLNPDGVIVGNYRCSIAARDLNRNYRFAREDNFPTIYHTKKLVENLKEICRDVALYCDLHGHSRKHNVFMYGCDSQYTNVEDVNSVTPILNFNTIQAFITDRIFPFLMQKSGPELFSFVGCHFKIRKCKESTGRVVMWKQYNISDSYTLETTFSGTDLNNPRHFSVRDLENVGKVFSESLSKYINIKENDKMKEEVGLELLKTIFKQLLARDKSLKGLFRKLLWQNAPKGSNDQMNDMQASLSELNLTTNLDVNDENFDLESLIDNLKLGDINQLDFTALNVSEIEVNSSSSDSDSESQPEEIIEVASKRPSKTKKKKPKNSSLSIKDQKDTDSKKPAIKRINSKSLPLIHKPEKLTKSPDDKINGKMNKKNSSPNIFSKIPFTPKFPTFLNKYDGRTNGGIPCFAEERVVERAKRKSISSVKKDLDDALFKIPLDCLNDKLFEPDPTTFLINDVTKTGFKTENRLITIFESSKNMAEQYQMLRKRASDILRYRNNRDHDGKALTENDEEQFLKKPILNMNQMKVIAKYPNSQQTYVKTDAINTLSPIIMVKEASIVKRFT